MNWSNMISHFLVFFLSLWRLSLHHFVFSCSHMWLMAVLCMVAGFVLCCTWVLFCKDIRSKKKLCCSLCCLVLLFVFVFDRKGHAKSRAAVNIYIPGVDVCPHTRAQTQTFAYVLSLLISCCLSLFRITVHTMWWTRRWVGIAIPRKLLSSSSLSLLFAVCGGWDVERGRRFAADALFFSLPISKVAAQARSQVQVSWSGFHWM